MILLEPHFKAIVSGSFAAYNLACLLPEGDVSEELKSILLLQCDILNCIVEGQHFGSRYLNQYTEYCDKSSQDAMRIKKLANRE